MKKTHIPVTLALYPNMRGFGYVCFEKPDKIIDHGVMRVRPVTNEAIKKRIQTLIEYFAPIIVILRDCNTTDKRQSARTQRLLQQLCCIAEEKEIKVYQYTRAQVRDVFGALGANTKYEIANLIVQGFPELQPRMPKPRDLWKPEDLNMGIFDAVALALTHNYLTE